MTRPRSQRASTRVDLRLGVAGRLVGIYDAIGASAAQQGGVVDRVPAKPAVPEAAMVR